MFRSGDLASPKTKTDAKKSPRGMPCASDYRLASVDEGGRFKSKHFHEKRSRFEKSKKYPLPLVGNVIESVLGGRVNLARAIQNFKIKVNATAIPSSTAQTGCADLPAAAYYYHFGDGDLCRSYLVKGLILENEKGVQIPASGRLRIGVFNTEDASVKTFVIPYDLSDMPRCSKTYLRQSNYYLPTHSSDFGLKWLRSFVRLKCGCSKSGRLYLQNEIDAIVFQKSDLYAACEFETKSDLKHVDVTEIEYKSESATVVDKNA